MRPEKAQSPGEPPLRVLVVDDSDIIRSLIRKTFALFAFDTVEAADGWEALMLLQQDRGFALLVIDLSMPRLDGLGLIQRLRGDTSMPHFPIIVLTAESLDPSGHPPEGADALMIKPFRPSALVETARRLIAEG